MKKDLAFITFLASLITIVSFLNGGLTQSVFGFSPSRGAEWPMWTIVGIVFVVTVVGIIWLTVKKR